jgi:hypothetical protein
MTNQGGHLRFGMMIAGAVACASILWAASFRHTAALQDNSSQSAQAQPSANPAQAYEGIVTDTRCGGKHSAAIGLSAGDCTRACVHSGEHFALVDGDKMYVLEGETEALKKAAGERVKVSGTLNGNTISVASVTTGSP